LPEENISQNRAIEILVRKIKFSQKFPGDRNLQQLNREIMQLQAQKFDSRNISKPISSKN
jgi:hypothetical protein